MCLIVSVISFLIHLLLIYVNKFGLIIINDPYNLLNNPILQFIPLFVYFNL